MPSALNEHIDDEEYLYRGLIPLFYKGRVTSAAFKDTYGTSVDRDNLERSEEECVERLKSNKRFMGVCRVRTRGVRDLDAFPIYKFLEDNPYHSEIHDSATEPQVRSSKARKLSKATKVCWIKER